MFPSRSVLRILSNRGLNGGVRAFSAAPGVGEKGELYTERMAKKGRPVSPHVEIYRFPTVAISSITNRVTGVMLSIGVSGIGAMAFMGADPSAVTTAIASAGSLAAVPKFAVAFPLVYHYLGGIRHIVWDRRPEQLTNEDVEKSSAVLIGGSVALSAGLALLTF